MANIAFLLARSNSTSDPAPTRRVLVIDWDFEAPGSHYYFRPYLETKSAGRFEGSPGCLELFERLERERSTESKYDPKHFVDNRKEAKRWFEAHDLEPYLLRTVSPGLSLIKAGCFDESYPRRVSTFRWDALFHATVGLFTGFADFLRSSFDFVLIDSRTGITDTGGICTMLLPDKLVVVFTPNQQSLVGIENLVREAVAYRRRSPDGRPLTIFPLLSRVDSIKPQLLEAWRNGHSSDPSIAAQLPAGMPGYQPMFEQLFAKLYAQSSVRLDEYFNEVVLQHIPDYSYGEPVAVELESIDSRISLARSYSAFRDRLVELDVPWNSLTEIRHQREIIRRCDAIDQRLKEKSLDDAITLGHSLIQQEPPERLFERWSKAVFEIARAVGPSASTLIREWEMVTIPRVDVAPSIRGEAFLNAGKLSQEMGDLVTATKLLDESIVCLADGFGVEHPATLTAIEQRASVALAGQDFVTACEHNEKALKVRRRVLGDNHPSTIQAMSKLAVALFERGDVQAARLLLDEIATRYRQMPDQAQLASLSAAAITSIDQNDYGGAKEVLKQMLAAYRRAEDDQQADALPRTAISIEAGEPPKVSSEPIAAVEFVRPPDLTDAFDLELYVAPGYQCVDKMTARPIIVGDARIDFPVLQACQIDGMTLNCGWRRKHDLETNVPSRQSSQTWATFKDNAVKLSRGERLRVYLKWIGWEQMA
jgi:eukaryotic-like serine/threonine-protein kinase